MARSSGATVATEPNTLRLVQQVAAGTAGAVVDGVFGASWVPTRGGLNGKGGFVEVELDPILNDASELTITLPPVGSDGRNNRDRLYFYSGTPDPQNPSGPRVPYMPGDEWFEVYRGNDLLAVGTPVSEQSDPSSLQIVCRDVLQPLRKCRETAAGFWCNGARDVFSHYSRAWKTVVASNFPNQLTNFPISSFTLHTSTDGVWSYSGVLAAAPGSLILSTTNASTHNTTIATAHTWSDSGLLDHSSWRAEISISSLIATGTPILNFEIMNGAAIVATLQLSPSTGTGRCATTQWGGAGAVENWNSSFAGLVAAPTEFVAPFVLAIEARERFLYFYVDGQCVGVAQRPFPNAATSSTATANLTAQLAFGGPAAMTAAVDYFVVRKTTSPLNGGTPGDYGLASSPSSGGLSGQYFDLSSSSSSASTGLIPTGSPLLTPSAARIDSGVFFVNPASGTPGWFPGALGAATQIHARWTGSIFLPLSTQDVHFTIPANGTNDASALWVGKTRSSESIALRNPSPFAPGWGGPNVSTSVGMRSLLGSKDGWYPIVFEYAWGASSTGSNSVGFTYDVGGAGTVPPPSVLSPYGVFNQQVANGDSHYDTLKTTLAETFALQFKTAPQKLESGNFPGSLSPLIRVGRDTDYKLGWTQAGSPQSTTTAEDNATTEIAQAQGLGGAASGGLTAEAFNFPVMGSHPSVLTESDNLPATSELSMLVLQLETLLALRSNVWQQVISDTTGQRQVQDTWPLTGALAEFDWQPGDGLRVNLPQVGIVDLTPRQIVSLRRMLYPDGMGANSAAFRPYPRDFESTIRRFIRSVYADRRAFQGQLAYTPATIVAAPTAASALLPADLKLVRQAELVIVAKSDASTWTVSINGTATGQTFTTPGVIDVSNFIGRNNGNEPRMIATIAGGTGTASLGLRLLELVPRS